MASLFQACKAAVRNNEGGTFNIGGYDIDIEMYSQQDIDDDIQYGDVAFGDDDESKIVLVANDTITIPAGYTLTPDSPKKSLVIFCNELVNNGTISMYQKAPNVLPHDYYIIQGSVIGSNRNIIIPAYANNAKEGLTGSSGNNGTNRNCGSGGVGGSTSGPGKTGVGKSGSGYAFGGGAGSGGAFLVYRGGTSPDVDSEYPMHGGNVSGYNTWGYNVGGVGNPPGPTKAEYQESSQYRNNFGCGGRIIIFCSSFENNGEINVNGTATKKIRTYTDDNAPDTFGGASGAGAIDLFYTNILNQGNLLANGGASFSARSYGTSSWLNSSPGAGGNGSITLTQWNLDKVIKEERKMFTKDNWVYLFSNYSQRLREDVI